MFHVREITSSDVLCSVAFAGAAKWHKRNKIFFLLHNSLTRLETLYLPDKMCALLHFPLDLSSSKSESFPKSSSQLWVREVTPLASRLVFPVLFWYLLRLSLQNRVLQSQCSHICDYLYISDLCPVVFVSSVQSLCVHSFLCQSLSKSFHSFSQLWPIFFVLRLSLFLLYSAGM